jgi:hypothetical protein
MTKREIAKPMIVVVEGSTVAGAKRGASTRLTH